MFSMSAEMLFIFMNLYFWPKKKLIPGAVDEVILYIDFVLVLLITTTSFSNTTSKEVSKQKNKFTLLTIISENTKKINSFRKKT